MHWYQNVDHVFKCINRKTKQTKQKREIGGDQETTSKTTDGKPGNNEWGW